MSDTPELSESIDLTTLGESASEEERLLEQEELDMESEWGLGEAHVPEPDLTPLQRSIQRVYGYTFADLSSAELERHLRLQPIHIEVDSTAQPQSSPLQDRSLPTLPVQTLSPPTRKVRTHLTDNDKIILMNLCVEYQAEHMHSKKTAFWLLISELLENQTGGLKLRDPQKTVGILVAKRKAEIKVQERESGTVQREDELTQKIDEWIKHEEHLERMSVVAGKSASALNKEAEEAAAHRRNMLVRLSDKRQLTVEDADETEKDAGVKELRSFRKKRRLESETQSLVGAVESLGQGMITAVWELVASRS